MAGIGFNYRDRAGEEKRLTEITEHFESGEKEMLVLNSEVLMIVDQEGQCSYFNPAVRNLLRIDNNVSVNFAPAEAAAGKVFLLPFQQINGFPLFLETRFFEMIWNGQKVYVARLENTKVMPLEQDALLSEFSANTHMLLNQLDFDSVLHSVLLQVLTFYQTSHGFIALAAEGESAWEVRALEGAFFKDLTLEDESQTRASWLSSAVQRDGVEMLFDAGLQPAQDPAVAALPLMLGSQIKGVLGLALEGEAHFSQEDLEKLRRFSRHISTLLIDEQHIDPMQVELAAHEAYEVRLHLQSRLLAGAADALRSLIDSQSIDQAVSEALSALGEASQVDHIYVFENTPANGDGDENMRVGMRFEWQRNSRNIRSVDSLQNSIPYQADMLAWKEMFENGKTVSCSRTGFACSQQTILDFCQTQALLLVPILVGDNFWGIMAFGDDHPGREWGEEENAILSAAAAGLGTVIEHRQVEDVLLATEERFKAFMNNTPLLVYIRDDQGHFDFINKQFRQIYHLPQDSFFGLTAKELFSEEIAAQLMQGEQEVLQEGNTLDHEYMHALPDGSIHHWRELKFPIDGPAGGRYVGGIIQDMTERFFAQEELKRWASELEGRNRELAMLSQMNKFLQACVRPEAAYSVLVEYARQLFPNISGILLMHTENGAQLYPAAWWGDEIDSDLTIAIDDCPAFVKEKQRHSNGFELAAKIEECEAFPWAEAHTRLCLPILAQEQAFGQAQVVGVMCMWDKKPDTFIYENQRQLAMTLSEQIGLTLSNLNLSTRLRQQAIRDPLTGLFNRRYLYETLERELKRSERDGQQTSVLMIDIDHFKRINDNYGHAAGDDALRHVGNILRQAVRGSDIACRYGGEEFVLALLNAGLDDAINRANQILTLVRKLRLQLGEEVDGVGITVSIGVASFPQHGVTTDTLLSAADVAMYKAKQKGRDCVFIAGAQGENR